LAAKVVSSDQGLGRAVASVGEASADTRIAPVDHVKQANGAATASSAARTTEQAALETAAPRRSGEALAEAFTAAVGAAISGRADQFVGDEWYVGINDSPVGPIPLSELRARAAKREVTIDSLVWRDGFEDWKSLRSFPELLAVVEEAISSIQASQGPVAAADYGPPIAFSPTLANQPSAVTAVSEMVARSSQVAVGQFAPVTSPSLTPEELASVMGSKVRRSPKGAWIAVAGALALGLAIGFVFFRQAPVAPEIKYVEVAHSGPSSAATSPNPSAASQEIPVAASAEETRVTNRRIAGGDAKGTPENNVAPTASAGLKGLSGLRGLGPQSGPAESGANNGSSSGQALDSATLQKTVSRYTASVRRSCWQPALDSRSPDAPTMAKVTVKIDIAPSGNVNGVSSNGDPRGYRGLASCIENRVRNWSFPPSSGATTVNIPFVFAAQ
jgi:hypothetical protein